MRSVKSGLLLIVLAAVQPLPASAQVEPCDLRDVGFVYTSTAARATFDFDASGCDDDAILRFDLSISILRAQRPSGDLILVARNNASCYPGEHCTVGVEHIHAPLEYAGYSALGSYVMERSDDEVLFGISNRYAGGCVSAVAAAVCGLP